MEADILQEGFSCSEAMHKLRYVSFVVGDGDSSVHSKILESDPYSRSIKKIECANHVTKNLTKHLFNLAKESNANKSLLTSAKIGLIGKTVRILARQSKRFFSNDFKKRHPKCHESCFW
jgi:hypothetical protein